MDSIDTSYNIVKQDYDKCFHEWYKQKYLTGHWEPNEEPCSELFKLYQQCLRGALVRKNMDTDEMIKSLPVKGVHGDTEENNDKTKSATD